MTESRPESPLNGPSSRRPRTGRAWMIAPVLGLTLAACRAGLPAEPPGADAADPSAESTPYLAQPNPYETSAFAGEPAPKAGGHAYHSGMDHSKMDHSKMDHSKMNHGAAEEKVADPEAAPAKAPMQGAPR